MHLLYIIIGAALVPVAISIIGQTEGSAIITTIINNMFTKSTIILIPLLIVSVGALILKGIKFKKQS